MEILQLCNKVPYPPIDGGAIATLNMTKGFSDLNHKVTVLSMNTSKHYFDLISLSKDIKKYANFVGVDVKANITATGAFLNLLLSNKPYNAQRFINLKFRKKLIELLENKKFDVIQLEGIYLAPYIKHIRMYSDALISLRAHNIEYEIWQRVAKQEENKLKVRYLNILQKRIKKFETSFINKYDVLVPITKRDLEIYNKLGNNKPAHVSQTGINSNELVSDLNNIEFPSLFHIGALDWAPNQEGLKWFFNNCWTKLNKKYPDLKFYVAGRNAPDNIVEYFKTLTNVVYVGEVENAYDFINSKAIMVVPLLSGSGMRIKIVEGMALGKAIVTTSIGTEGINSTNKEDIFIADTPETFVLEIEKLLRDKNLVMQTGKNAIDFIVKNFDNKIITSSLVDFYDNNR